MTRLGLQLVEVQCARKDRRRVVRKVIIYPFNGKYKFFYFNPFYTLYAALRIVRDYTGYASVRVYMRIHDSHHQLSGFAILKIKNKIKFPMGLCEASFPLPASWGPPF